MIEGWFEKTYWSIFASAAEAQQATQVYGIHEALPGHTLVALRSWDDFLLLDSSGKFVTVPTVPLDPKYLEPASPPPAPDTLQPDPRFAGRIKWYVKPLVFGGDPKASDNVAPVSPEQHAELVRWWNGKYREVRDQKAPG